jgi:transcriptional regulator with XRE-family HTH domain
MTQDPEPDWSARLAFSVAREVRRHRQAQGLSAQQLADRCAQIGMPIQRSVLANLESGRRTTITVAEVLVLAHALNVPPGVLMFPAGHEVQTEVLPGAYTEPGSAVDWLAGRTFLDHDAAEKFFDTPLGLVRLHQDQVTTLRRSVRSRDHAREEFADIAARYRGEEERYVRAESERAAVYRQLEELGVLDEQSSRVENERYRALFDRHEQLAKHRDLYATGARQYRYAAQRVENLERSVTKLEARLREIRERMKGEGLVPPLLPRALAYIDPERPTLEDIPERRAEGLSSPSVPVDLKGELGELNVSIEEEEDLPPLISPEQSDEARGVLEEMKPYLTDIITEAMEKVMKRRRDQEEN